MRSYVDVLNAYYEVGKYVSSSVVDEVRTCYFILVNPANHSWEITFTDETSVEVCEAVYKEFWWNRCVGVGVLTNRDDLFVEEGEYQQEMLRLKAKRTKIEKKLRKTEAKIAKIKEAVK